MSFAVLSILFLIGAIAVGFWRKLNVGLLSIAAAFIFGHLMGVPDNKILTGFSSNLFMSLLGVTFLFSVLTQNKTIDVVAKRIVSLVGKRSWLIPIVMFMVGYIMTGIGPGAIPMLAIMPAFAIPVAIARGYNPLMMALIADFGVFSGRMAPITPESILVHELLASSGIVENVTMPIVINQTLTGIVCAVLAFIYYKGYEIGEAKTEDMAEDITMNRDQLISLTGLIVMVLMVVLFRYNVGLVSFLVGSILLCLRVAPEGPSLKNIPWGVLIMVTGVGLLMKLVIDSGGIDLMSQFLASFMNSYTAPAVMGVTSGIMSWFSSGLGVVFPTLIPTVPVLSELLGGGSNPVVLASLIVIGGTFTGVSPFSTTGGLILATIMTEDGNQKTLSERKDEQNKIFLELLIWSVITMVILTVMALLNVYSIVTL